MGTSRNTNEESLLTSSSAFRANYFGETTWALIVTTTLLSSVSPSFAGDTFRKQLPTTSASSPYPLFYPSGYRRTVQTVPTRIRTFARPDVQMPHQLIDSGFVRFTGVDLGEYPSGLGQAETPRDWENFNPPASPIFPDLYIPPVPPSAPGTKEESDSTEPIKEEYSPPAEPLTPPNTSAPTPGASPIEEAEDVSSLAVPLSFSESPTVKHSSRSIQQAWTPLEMTPERGESDDTSEDDGWIPLTDSRDIPLPPVTE